MQMKRFMNVNVLTTSHRGLEMDEEDSTFTDGTFQSERFFSCAPSRALFIPLSRCKLDSRFQDQDVVDNAKAIDTEVWKTDAT